MESNSENIPRSFSAKSMEDFVKTLPIGYRFYPFDGEVIDHLAQKIEDPGYTTPGIGEVDLNKCEPWVAIGMAMVGEVVYYVFAKQGRKYPNGPRIDRSTDAGYWKPTGKDKEIYSHGILIGKRKTFVFYLGRASNGVKQNWVMNEFSIVCSPPTFPQKEWVVARISYNGDDGCERKNPFEKHIVLESAIMSGAMSELPSMPDQVPQPLMEPLVLEDSSMTGFTDENGFDFEFTDDYLQIPGLTEDFDVMRDLPAPNDESEFLIDDWLNKLQNEEQNEIEKETEKEKEDTGGFDEEGEVYFTSVKRRRI